MTDRVLLPKGEIAEFYPTDDPNRKIDSLYNDVAREAVKVAVTTDAWAIQYTGTDEGITRDIVAMTLDSMDSALIMATYRLTYKAFCDDAKSGMPIELNRMHELAQTSNTNPGGK